jgi:DNA-binding XRE family transcriptional regulator
VRKKENLQERDLAELAKKAREKAGKTRAQAARDMGVRQASIFNAEERPELSLTRLRIRMIEAYTERAVIGPFYSLTPR